VLGGDLVGVDVSVGRDGVRAWRLVGCWGGSGESVELELRCDWEWWRLLTCAVDLKDSAFYLELELCLKLARC
jgi:hypothetical protein